MHQRKAHPRDMREWVAIARELGAQLSVLFSGPVVVPLDDYAEPLPEKPGTVWVDAMLWFHEADKEMGWPEEWDAHERFTRLCSPVFTVGGRDLTLEEARQRVEQAAVLETT